MTDPTRRGALFAWIMPGVFMLGFMGPAQEASAVANIAWMTNPTPVTLTEFEVGITPRGRLISWQASGEWDTLGYRVQVRRPGGSWGHASPLIIAERVGTEGHFYAWHDRTDTRGQEYRLAEIYKDGMVDPLDVTDPDRRAARAEAPGPARRAQES